MSHTVTVKTEFSEVERLKSAIERLNKSTDGKLTLKENDVCRVWGGRQVKCSLVLSHPDSSYDLGFNLSKDQTYSIVGESYVAQAGSNNTHNAISRALGPNYQNLNQAYAVEVALDSLRYQTVGVTESILADGRLCYEVEVRA
jgi:hypothetical protein